MNVSDGKIIKAWNDPLGSYVGGITQVLPVEKDVFLFGSDMAPALSLLKL